ncbi:hypothetical protein GGQ64_001323 [Rhizobium azooxidifex]|uniref:Uncharacterized protein n=1 Tax=Mycoplana azooxidifex TaxID=1636188 RepID=A0A7W6D7N3_9HYPH|nr:hypothetical protein [Mycoplana azooxidifex]
MAATAGTARKRRRLADKIERGLQKAADRMAKDADRSRARREAAVADALGCVDALERQIGRRDTGGARDGAGGDGRSVTMAVGFDGDRDGLACDGHAIAFDGRPTTVFGVPPALAEGSAAPHPPAGTFSPQAGRRGVAATAVAGLDGDRDGLASDGHAVASAAEPPSLAAGPAGGGAVLDFDGREIGSERLGRSFRLWALERHPAQEAPKGDWRVWLLMGGRGSGKTRAGAEWVHEVARRTAKLRIALVAETLGDAREVMIDGVSGICRIARRERPEFEASRRRLVWPNGTIAQIFSSEDPESLRGPQFHLAWCDELHRSIVSERVNLKSAA